MTEGEKKRSRRRFLADMLFVGGGISAAALLAKSQIAREPQATPPPEAHPPDIAGDMIAPEGGMRAPEPTASPCEVPTALGEALPPEALPDIEGNRKAPVQARGVASQGVIKGY